MGIRLLLLTMGAIVLAGCASVASPSPGTPGASSSPPAGSPSVDVATIGRDFIEAIATGDLAAAEAMEDDTLRRAAPGTALAQIWSQLEGGYGAFGSIGEVTTASTPPYVTATVQVSFAGATVPLLVTVDAEGRVAGLHLGEAAPVGSAAPSASPEPSAEASPAAYVDPDAFTETEVTVGEAPWALSGTLSMPKGAGPFPAVVLVAGSGAQDRDETIGPNKPLRDLAWGLASNGVAALRYEKRTKAYGQQLAAQAGSVTVKEETVDDAVAAVDLLRATQGIDPERVFVAGHSLGGYLAPRIAEQAGDRVAGIAMLEANSRPLVRLIADQLAYLASDEGGADPQAKAMLDALPAQIALAESPDLSPSTPASQLPLGVPAPYWLDLRAYDAPATARDLAMPILLVQGGRDYQVPPSELAGWRTALQGRDDVTIREYPALNHLLLAGTGPSRPAEYAQPGHVAPEVVADLAAWVQAAGR